MEQRDNYLPIEHGLLTQIISLLNIKPGETFCDLGSGDGRAVIAAAQQGAIATGVELEPIRVQESRQNILNANVSASIIEGDMFETDLAIYDVVYTYLSHDSLHRLFPKYQQTATAGNRIVMWCGYGTQEAIVARACSDCSYLVDQQTIPGAVMHKIVSDVDGVVHYILIVTTPQE